MVNVVRVSAAFRDERGDFLDVALGAMLSNSPNHTPNSETALWGFSGSDSGKSRIHGAW